MSNIKTKRIFAKDLEGFVAPEMQRAIEARFPDGFPGNKEGIYSLLTSGIGVGYDTLYGIIERFVPDASGDWEKYIALGMTEDSREMEKLDNVYKRKVMRIHTRALQRMARICARICACALQHDKG